MPANIDIQCTVQLPNSASHVFVRLVESRPERVRYRINLRDSNDNVNPVVREDRYFIPVPHDLGRANHLRGLTMICVGEVGFSANGPWDLRCEFFLDDNLFHTCGPGELNGAQGSRPFFRFTCLFT